MMDTLEYLAAAARQFRFYEQHHREKAVKMDEFMSRADDSNDNNNFQSPEARAASLKLRDDTIRKAEVNADMASEIEEHLASQPLETLIAQIAHQANKAWCVYLGDLSQRDWPEAPDWAKQSAQDGVRFHRDNPDAGDEASHENWLALKVQEGWVYGRPKNPDTKTHPCIVPFADLSPEQQFKDRLFRTVVHAAFHL